MIGATPPLPPKTSRGMSLIELIVTMAVLALLFSILLGVVVQSQQVFQRANREISAAQLSREVFQVLRDKFRLATLSSVPRFFDSTNYSFQSPVTVDQVRPFSQLSYVSGPSAGLLNRDVNSFPGDAVFWPAQSGQAQLSGQTVSGLLEGLGCLVRYGDDSADFPTFLQAWRSVRYRYRLMLYREAPEQFTRRLQPNLATSFSLRWYHDLLPDNLDPASSRVMPQSQVLGENVVALLVQPLQASGAPYSIGRTYNSYDWSLAGAKDLEPTQGSSYGRIPDTLRVGLVMLSPASAQRLSPNGEEVPALGLQLEKMKESDDWVAGLERVKQQVGPELDLHLHETLITLPRQP